MTRLEIQVRGAEQLRAMLGDLTPERRRSLELRVAGRVGKSVAAEMRRRLKSSLRGPSAKLWRSRVRWLKTRSKESVGTLQVLGQGKRGRANFYPRQLQLKAPKRGAPTWNDLGGPTTVAGAFAVRKLQGKNRPGERGGYNFVGPGSAQFDRRKALVFVRTGARRSSIVQVHGPSAGEVATRLGLVKWAEAELGTRYGAELARQLELQLRRKARK